MARAPGVVERRMSWLRKLGWSEHPTKLAMISSDDKAEVALLQLAMWDDNRWADWCKGKDN